MLRLLLLFITLPALELALLIWIGRYIGVLQTLGIIAVTGILGAFLARRQGLGVLQKIQREWAQGRLPAGSIVDGVIILIAAAVLLTPGLITDLFGFCCLVPSFRNLLKQKLLHRFQLRMRRQRASMEGVLEVEAREVKEKSRAGDTR